MAVEATRICRCVGSLVDDPLIDDLILVSVIPAPSAARVQVTLVPSHDRIDCDAALVRLREVSSELREEVAAEVARARVPELVFRIADLAPAD